MKAWLCKRTGHGFCNAQYVYGKGCIWRICGLTGYWDLPAQK